MSKTSSQLAREKDDDSPYFLMIALDSRFLQYMEDPRLENPMEIAEKCDLFMENNVFKEIVRGEINRMFQDNAQVNPSERPDEITSGKSINMQKMAAGMPISEESSRQNQSKDNTHRVTQEVPLIDFKLATDESLKKLGKNDANIMSIKENNNEEPQKADMVKNGSQPALKTQDNLREFS